MSMPSNTSDIIGLVSLVIGILSFGISGFSLFIMLRISKEQNKQLTTIQVINDNQTTQLKTIEGLNDSIDKKILGILPNFEEVHAKIVARLEQVKHDQKSKVYIMAYWLWFGIDRHVSKVPLEDLDSNHSRIWELLTSRISENLETHIIIYDPVSAKDKLKKFVSAVLKYNLDDKSQKEQISDEKISNLIEKYKNRLGQIEKSLTKISKTSIHKISEVPVLSFVVQGGGEYQSGVLYLGETLALERKAKTGGFSTFSPEMVDILVSHYNHLKDSNSN